MSRFSEHPTCVDLGPEPEQRAWVWKTYEPSRIRRGRTSTCATWHGKLVNRGSEITANTCKEVLARLTEQAKNLRVVTP